SQFRRRSVGSRIFPDHLCLILPPLGSREGISNPIVRIKFFTRDADWAWYVTEGSPEDDDFLFFGFVFGFEQEWQTSRYPSWPNYVVRSDFRSNVICFFSQIPSAELWQEKIAGIRPGRLATCRLGVFEMAACSKVGRAVLLSILVLSAFGCFRPVRRFN